MGGKDIKQKPKNLPPILTPRQVEILNLIKLGLSDKAIGFKLGITEGAVSNRISHGILARLGASNRAHAVYIALKKGIITCMAIKSL